MWPCTVTPPRTIMWICFTFAIISPLVPSFKRLSKKFSSQISPTSATLSPFTLVVFGESNKDIYFPHAKWHIINREKTESSALEPDTVMKLNGKFYILDAKYYKFGITGLPMHLPATSSIQKQITYGD